MLQLLKQNLTEAEEKCQSFERAISELSRDKQLIERKLERANRRVAELEVRGAGACIKLYVVGRCGPGPLPIPAQFL